MFKSIRLTLVYLSLLQLSILNGQHVSEIVKADSNEIIEGDTAYTFLVAASKGDSALTARLLNSGVNVNTLSLDGWPALMYALNNHHNSVARLLVEHGAELNKRYINGNTPLILAIKNGDLVMAEYLIRKGADLDMGDSKGITPLMYAVGIDSIAIADMLLYYGADPLKTDNYGNSALMIASVTGNYDIVLMLLESGADPNNKNIKGFTPLHAATWYGYWGIMELLLDYGANPDIAAQNGYTPIAIAAEINDLYALEMLSEAGANLHQKLSHSQNLRTLAAENNNDSITAFLRANNVRYNFWPGFNKFGLGTEMTGNLDDYYLNFYFLAAEKKYNLHFGAGIGFRPSAIRVLENFDETYSYQYWERRGNLFLSLDKSVYLFRSNSGNFMAGIYGGVKGIYTFGSYRGSNNKPDDRILSAPVAGITLDTRYSRFTIGYEYMNLRLYKVNPNLFNISFSIKWNRKKNNFNPDFIRW
jgi:ankyrin repeat protein